MVTKLEPTSRSELAQLLRGGGVAVLRTDTIYGIVAKADSKEAVGRVYAIKGRTPTKSPIVLIARPEDMFDAIAKDHIGIIKGLWPGKNSIIFPSVNAPEWIRRGNDSVAYRVPADDDLRALLKETGPLIAPSANPEGEVPAMNIDEAVSYFGDKVDRYIDGGAVADNTPSRLFLVTSEGLEQLR